MATRTVVCPDCDAPLSPGRLSCSFCGALVASVASRARTMRISDDPPPAPALEGIAAPKPARSRSRSTKVARTPDDGAALGATPAVVDAPDADAADPADGRGAVEPRAFESAAVPPAPTAVAAEPMQPAPTAVAAEPMWSALTAPPAEPRPTAPPAEPPAAPPAVNPPPVAPFGAEPPGPSAPPAVPPAPPTPRNPAGAYLPPSAVLPPAEALPLPAAKRAAGEERRKVVSPGAFGSIQLSVSPRAGSTAIAGGAGMAILGFLLPWADIVLGSATMGGYFDRWGLAGPGHAIVLAFVAAVAGLAVIADRLPRWARPRIVAIGIAGLLFGLVWPYVFGPYNASLGVFFVAVGAVVMLGGGVLDLLLSRHGDRAASV